MSKTILRLALLSLVLFFVPVASAAPIFVDNGQVLTNGVLLDDAYMAGGNVTINHPIQGDLKVAGGNVTVNGDVTGSLYVAGGTVTVNGNVGNDAYVVGGTVQLSGRVDDDLFVGSGNLEAAKTTEVGGSAFIRSGNVLWMGTVKERMRLESQSVTFGGTVRGDLDLRAEGVVTILPDAKVEGDGRYLASHEPTFDPAFVRGKFSYSRNENVSSSQLPEVSSWINGLWLVFSFTNLIASAILGVILIFLFPNLLRRTGEIATAKPLRVLGEGFLVMLVIVMVTIGGFVSVLGIKLAIILLAYMSTLTTVVGTVNGYLLGHWLMRRTQGSRWNTVGFFLLGAVVYAFISLLPYVGVVVWVGLSFISIGAFYRAESEAYQAMRSQTLL